MSSKRTISIYELMSMKFKTIELSPNFQKLLGSPEPRGSWFLSGLSGHGKTSFMMQLMKELCEFGKVAYNSIEEGPKRTFQLAAERHQMDKLGSKFNLWEKHTLDDMSAKLSKPRSPKFIFIDSVQYVTKDDDSLRSITRYEYKKFMAKHPDKVFIWISHVDAQNKPEGSLAKAIEYDSDIKLWVEGFKAFARSRYGSESDYIIWGKGAAEYWNN